MALLHSSLLQCSSISLYLTLHFSTIALPYSTLINQISTSLYLTLHYSTTAVLNSTLLYRSFTSFYLNLHYSTMALLYSTWLYISLAENCFTLQLKDFIEDELGLQTDEFNRVPIAGIHNTERLRQMLNSAAMAFLVLTGEDEQPDGKPHARLNVVHEAGLFQGRLGFECAIVMLEEGCEEFSNIDGLGQLRFARGDIRSRFEEVRQVLRERLGMVGETG